MQNRTIIVGYDGREPADDAVALGARLAELIQARLLLAFAYGVEAIAPPADGEWGGVPPAVGADRVLRRGLRGLPYGSPAHVRAVPDSPAGPVLANLAEAEHADLIVIGSTEWGPVSRVLIGSVGQRLLQSAARSVAVAPKGFRHRKMPSVHRIGVCWDGSHEAVQALERASALARERRAQVRIYTVARAYAVPNGEVRLADACRRVPRPIDVQGEVLQGDPATAIARRAEEDDLDLLLLGSRSHGPVRSALLGSVSEMLVRTAPCPVLIVPHGATAEARLAARRSA
jgi:nucleotide-binding universal stress UspA family protein